jgi:hypothetical protein
MRRAVKRISDTTCDNTDVCRGRSFAMPRYANTPIRVKTGTDIKRLFLLEYVINSMPYIDTPYIIRIMRSCNVNMMGIPFTRRL